MFSRGLYYYSNLSEIGFSGVARSILVAIYNLILNNLLRVLVEWIRGIRQFTFYQHQLFPRVTGATESVENVISERILHRVNRDLIKIKIRSNFFLSKEA